MIYLVRHGETDWNAEKKIQGHTDIALNQNGRKQAKELANTIAHLKIDKIISSDLLRARETAEIVNEEINKRVSFDTRIKEVGFGLLEGIKIENITPKLWDTYNLNPEVIEAESKEHVFERVKEFFDELQFSKDNILIVTHGGILRMIMYYSKNKEKFYMDKYLEFKNVKIKNVDIFEWKDELKVYKKEG